MDEHEVPSVWHEPEAAHAPLAEKTIAEHAEARELKPWQQKALLARFAGTGLDRHSTLSDEAFDKALAETLHGRI